MPIEDAVGAKATETGARLALLQFADPRRRLRMIDPEHNLRAGAGPNDAEGLESEILFVSGAPLGSVALDPATTAQRGSAMRYSTLSHGFSNGMLNVSKSLMLRVTRT